MKHKPRYENKLAFCSVCYTHSLTGFLFEVENEKSH